MWPHSVRAPLPLPGRAELLGGPCRLSGLRTWAGSGSFFCGQTASCPQPCLLPQCERAEGTSHPPPGPCSLSCATGFSVTAQQTRPAQPALSRPAPWWGSGGCPAEAPSLPLPASSCHGFGLECDIPSPCLRILLLSSVNCDTLGQGLCLYLFNTGIDWLLIQQAKLKGSVAMRCYAGRPALLRKPCGHRPNL